MSFLSTLPYANVTLLKVAGGGFSEDGDTPAGNPPARWEGEADGYLGELLLTDTTSGSVDELEHVRLTFESSTSQVNRGDFVTYRDRDDEEVTRKVANVQNFDLLGLVRVTFTDE